MKSWWSVESWFSNLELISLLAIKWFNPYNPICQKQLGTGIQPRITPNAKVRLRAGLFRPYTEDESLLSYASIIDGAIPGFFSPSPKNSKPKKLKP